MNDFTKEELETFMHGLYHANIHDWPVGKKLQAMIDNYCEHIPTDYGGECLICGADLCFKCSRPL